MANEAVVVELLGNPKGEVIDFTINSGANVEKGTLMYLADGRKCFKTDVQTSASIAVSGAFAGIAATEHVGTEGSPNCGLWQKGIFVLTADSTTNILRGNKVTFSGANFIRNATAVEVMSGACIGKALEDIAAGTTGEVLVGYG